MIRFFYKEKEILQYYQMHNYPLQKGDVFIYEEKIYFIDEVLHKYVNVQGGSGFRNIYIETTVILK